MRKYSGVLLALIFVSSFATGQSTWQVGTGKSSLEPDKSLISLALSGYAAPLEGRFSLQWIKRENLSDVRSMTGSADNLYVISNGVLLRKSVTAPKSAWESAGKAGNLIAIAADGDKLYALSTDGELLVSVSSKVKWTKKGSVDRSASSLTVSGGKVYAASNTGTIWVTDISSSPVSWSAISTNKGIISLAALNGDIFALTEDGTIYKGLTGGNELKWTKIAYKNNVTIKEDMKLIAMAGNGIFGMSRENVLYAGEHRTDGNLSARAMAIKNNNKTVIILNIDLVSLDEKFTGMVKDEIRKKYNIEPSAVLMNISHTHFAPVVQDWPTWMEYNHHPNQTYLYSTVKNGILNAVDAAVRAMAPAKLYFGRGKTDIGYNRSLPEHPELYDSSVDVLKVKYDNNTESYLFLASCHPVFSTAGKLHFTLSANYPGVARKLVEERTNSQNSLFLQGTCGDINPRDNGQYIAGEKLSNEVIAVLNRPMTEVSGEITFFLDTFNIPVTPMTKEELAAFKESNSNKPKDIGAIKNVNYADIMMANYEKGTLPKSNPVYVHTINIGNWKLVGFSRETTSEYSLGVKEMYPGQLVSVAGYSNDVSSYLPTSLHVGKKNYEGFDSFLWYGAVPFPSTVNQTIMNELKTLKR